MNIFKEKCYEYVLVSIQILKVMAIYVSPSFINHIRSELQFYIYKQVNINRMENGNKLNPYFFILFVFYFLLFVPENASPMEVKS